MGPHSSPVWYPLLHQSKSSLHRHFSYSHSTAVIGQRVCLVDQHTITNYSLHLVLAPFYILRLLRHNSNVCILLVNLSNIIIKIGYFVNTLLHITSTRVCELIISCRLVFSTLPIYFSTIISLIARFIR